MYKLSILFGLLLITALTHAKDGTELTKTFTDSFEVNANARVDIYASSTQLTIETWDKNVVEVEIVLDVRAEDPEEAQRFLALAKPKIMGSAASVSISNQLEVSKMVCTNNSTKAWFNDAKGKVVIQDYSYRMMVKMPKTNGLDLNARYTPVSLGDLSGPVSIQGVDADFAAGNLKGPGNLKLSYGKAHFGSLSELNDIKLFEVEFNAGDLGNLDLKTRYSQLDIASAGEVEIKSFEDEIDMKSVKSIDGKMSYSKLELENGEELDLEMFESKIKGGDFKVVELDAKYSEIKLRSVDELETVDFENEYEIEHVGSFEGEGKYSEYEFDELTTSLRFEGLEDKVRVERLTSSVDKVRMTGKYMTIDLRPESSLVFNLEVDMQYTDLDYPTSLFHPVSISDKNRLQFLATSNKPNPKNVLFTFDCYEGSVELFTP